MSQNNSGDGQQPVTTCSTTADGTGSLSTRTRINASSNTALTLPISTPPAPHRGAASANGMYIEGTITRSVDGRTAAVPFFIDTRTGLWRHWGHDAGGETAELIEALRNAACDLT